MIHWLNPRCLRRASSACSKCMVLISVVNELLLNFICCNLQLAEGAFQFRCLPACPRQLCWLVSEWKGITWVLVEVTGANRVRLWCFPILYIIFNHNEMIVYPLMHGLLEEKNKWQLRELLMFRKDPGFCAFSFLNNEILGGGGEGRGGRYGSESKVCTWLEGDFLKLGASQLLVPLFCSPFHPTCEERKGLREKVIISAM